MKCPYILRRAFSGFSRRLPTISVNNESKSIPKLSSINGFCRISDSIPVENFMRQPPQQILYQTPRQNFVTDINAELQEQLNSTQALEDTMNLLSPDLSGEETLQGNVCTYLLGCTKCNESSL